MKHFFDSVVIAIIFFTTVAMSGHFNSQEAIVVEISSTLPVIDSISLSCDVDTTEVLDTTIIVNPRLELPNDSLIYDEALAKKEWFPFKYKKYQYDTIAYKEAELIHFANILYRESGNATGTYLPAPTNAHLEIDQYLIAICAIRTIQSELHPYDKCRNLTDMIHNGQFKVENSIAHWDNFHWRQCYKVVKNVVQCKIPSHIPYIPYGTFCYWNSRLDTNVGQKRYLERDGIHVATSARDHHYFAIAHYCKAEEIAELIEYGPCSQLDKYGTKDIKNGILCSREGDLELSNKKYSKLLKDAQRLVVN